MSEDVLIPVVDKDDNILCYKPRGGLEPGDIGRVASLWVMNSSKDVLIAQRSFKKKKDPGLWCEAVTGTVEKGETYESNIIKEANEEIGLHNVKPIIVGKFFFNLGARPLICTIFYCVIDQPISFFKRQEDEVEQLMWIRHSDLVQNVHECPEKYTPDFPEYITHVQHLHEGKK